MKGILAVALFGLLLAGRVSAAAESSASGLPDLPQWSPSDYDKLKKGEIIAGQDFFGKPKEGEEGELPEDLLPEAGKDEPGSEKYVTEISPLHLKRYFGALPRDSERNPILLSDPQELLAQQEYRDRASFLQYHSTESTIDMFVYLFDARQELPEGTTIESVFQKLYSTYGRVAVVFYFLGAPERAQMVLAEELRAIVSEDEQRRGLRAAVQEAFEKSDSAYQLDNFLVELSIRLYWIERELAGAGKVAQVGATEASVEKAAATARAEDRTRRLIGRALLWFGIMGGIGLVGWLGRTLVDRRIRYQFPEVETGSLLGAPHAAGVGAVVSFSSAQIPPSQQRDQVPDYLQRM